MAKVIMHIGVHGLFPRIFDLAQSVDGDKLRKAGIFPILSPMYREHLCSAVAAGDGSLHHPAIAEARNSPVVAGIEASGTYILSNDLLLAADTRIAKNGLVYPEATRRVSNLLAIFSGHEIHFKLFLCEFSLFSAANSLPELKGSADADWPWTSLVCRVLEGAGDAELSVWGVRPTEELRPLLPAAFIGEGPALNRLLRKAPLLRKAFLAEFAMTASALGGVKGTSPSDLPYDHFRRELEAISRLPAVTVHEG